MLRVHVTSGNLGQGYLKFKGGELDSKENPNSKIACLKVSAVLSAKWKGSMGIREKGQKILGADIHLGKNAGEGQLYS